MSYTELEHGYQGLRKARTTLYVGDESANVRLVKSRGDLSELNDDELCGEEGKQVVVGVCAMAKKSQSKPMKEILTRLEEFEYIKMIVFAEEVILQKPVHEWPTVDCLISFHSKGFPLEKAIQYAALRNPFVINNLHMQYDIQDRRKVYSILESEGIEIPRYAVLDRDSSDPTHHELVESEDHVEVNGVTFNKPFVEKPVSAEDHNIYIYYPTSAGGGSQRLFRKIGSRSSVYSPESRVRKTGSFIYEDFMPTDGTDVKVYTVGPDYAHAEARKSPALDGKVERDSEGKEIRYPVILSNAEKLISRKVCLAFKQTVCGFDLLRANGKSFVCDVNGFSFVKNSNKYYDDCAKILGNMILRELAPTLHIPWSVPFQLDDPPIVPTTFGKMMELRCVVAVIRHGDRTPKQKMKVEVRHPKFFEIFEKYGGPVDGHVKLKRPKQLQEILDIARSLLSEIEHRAADPEIEEKQGKLEQLKSVLEMYGHFSGINRKVQMKYQPKGRPRGSSSDDGKWNNAPKEPSLVLILKWGGELTPAGRVQAEELGRIFRCMYPGGQGEYAGTQGLGLLRLHSTFRHDLKIYASDEGRVQMTAAAFAKGLLALEGELTPILVQMVKSANTNGLLDNDCDASKHQNMAKARLHELMQQDRVFTQEDREIINPCNSISINIALDFVKNPVKCCERVQDLIQRLMSIVRAKKDDPKTKDAILYHGESWELMMRRWGKIEKDFCTKNKTFDISKIPDIYDCIKYDLQHNQHTLQFEQAEELYINAKYLADIVIPQEYGLTKTEKLTISQGICTPLLKKIRADLQRNIEESGDESVNRLNPRYSHGVSSPGRHVRTRLYFTSESHIHSLLTVLRHGGLLDCVKDEQWRRAMEYVSMVSELNYMSQVVVMLYEDPTKDPYSEERFHVELHFSPGVNCCVQKNLPPGPGFRPHSRNDQSKNLSSIEQEDTHTDESSSLTPTRSNSPGASDSSSTEKKSQDSVSSDFKIKMTSSEPIPIKLSVNTTDLTLRMIDEQNQSLSMSAQDPRPPTEPEPRSRSYDQNRGNEQSECSTDKTDIASVPKSSNVSGVLTEFSKSNRINIFEKSSDSYDKSYLEKLKKFNNLKKGDTLENVSGKYLLSKFNRSLSTDGGLNKKSLVKTNFKQGHFERKRNMSVGRPVPEMYDNDMSDSKLDIRSLDLANVEVYSSRGQLRNIVPQNYKALSVNSSNFTYETKSITAHNENKITKEKANDEFKNLNFSVVVTSPDDTSSNTSTVNQPSLKEFTQKEKFKQMSDCKIYSESNVNNCHNKECNDDSLNVNIKQINGKDICIGLSSISSEQKERFDNSRICEFVKSKKKEENLDNRISNDYSSSLIGGKDNYIKQNSETSLFVTDKNNEVNSCNTPSLVLSEQEERNNKQENDNYKMMIEFENVKKIEDSDMMDTIDEEKSSCNTLINELEHQGNCCNNCKVTLTENCEEQEKGQNYADIDTNVYHHQSAKLNNGSVRNDESPFNFEKSVNIPSSKGKSDNEGSVLTNNNIAKTVSGSSLKSPKFVFVKNKLSSQRSAPEFYSDAFIQSQNKVHSAFVNQYFQVVDDPDILDFPTSSISETRVKYPLKNTIDETEISHFPYPSTTRRTHSVSHCLEMTRLSPPSLDPGPSRRHRHSISGQMSYFRMSGYGLIIQHQKRGGSTSSLFSTAVISGSSSAPNLRDMIPNSGSVTAAIDGCGGVPPIRPLETLHNALSLRQLDSFLDKMTHSNIYRTPASSPPKIHSAPLPENIQSPSNSMVWSGPPSFVSSSGPSSPNGLSDFFRGTSGTSDSSDMSASIISNDGLGLLGPGRVNSVNLLSDENSYYSHRDGIEISDLYAPHLNCSMLFSPHTGGDSGELTPVSVGSEAEQVYRPFLEDRVMNEREEAGGGTIMEDFEAEAMVCEDEEEEKTLTAFTRDECSRPRLAEIKWHRDDEEKKVKKFAYGRFECSEAILEKPSSVENQSTASVPNVSTTIFGNEFNADVGMESVEGTSSKYSTLHHSDLNKKQLSSQNMGNEAFVSEEVFKMDSETTETKSPSADINSHPQKIEENCSSHRGERKFSELSKETIISRSVSPVLTVASSLKDSKNISRGFVIPQPEPDS